MFSSFTEWVLYARKACVTFFIGLYSMGYAVVIGLASLFRALWRRLTKLVGNYPNIALGTFLVALFLSWLMTFVVMRAHVVVAEDQRDSISYQYYMFKEQHGYK